MPQLVGDPRKQDGDLSPYEERHQQAAALIARAWAGRFKAHRDGTAGPAAGIPIAGLLSKSRNPAIGFADLADVKLLRNKKLEWGKIKFKTGREISETARFLRVPSDVDMDELHQFLTNKATWGLDSAPSLLVSITGQAGGEMSMRPNHLRRLSSGLMGAALSTDAWIVTGGMDAGIMNTIGKMQSMHQVGTPCIGIATWGCVKNHIQVRACIALVVRPHFPSHRIGRSPPFPFSFALVLPAPAFPR
jgi:hypothetical protein